MAHTVQIKGLFGDCGRHRIEEGDTYMAFMDPLLLLLMDKP